MQGTLYPEGSIISQGLMVVFLLLSFYYFSLLLVERNLPWVLRSLQYLAILYGIYGILRIGVDTTGWKQVNDATTYFKAYENSILPFFAYYYFSITYRINSRWFYNMFFLFVGVAVAQFFYQWMHARLLFGREEVTNNAGYFVLSLLPLIVFLKRNALLQYSALFFIFILVIQGMKRGAIISMVVAGIYFLWVSISRSKGDKKILYIFIASICLIAGIFLFRYMLLNSDYMQMRLERTQSGDMSNREDMYPVYLNYFFENADNINLIFGYGADGTLKNMGEFAHQDWIETLMNNGVLGFLLLLNFWISTLVTLIKSRTYDCASLSSIITMFVIIYLLKSMVSMSINSMMIFSTSAFAFAVAAMNDEYILEDLSDIEFSEEM